MKQHLQPRKLDRRNAVKYIDYDAGSNSFSSSSTVYEDHSLSNNRSVIDCTSFRIVGGGGEVDQVCQYIGLQPEELSVPLDDWEARKSLSPASILMASSFEDQRVADFGSRVSGGLVNGGFVLNPHVFGEVIPNSVRSGKFAASKVGLGIKGHRPPKLAPPPVRTRSSEDYAGSTWDVLRSFGPQDDQDFNSSRNRFNQGNVGVERSKTDSINGHTSEVLEMEMVIREDSCSDSSNDENESEPVGSILSNNYTISPIGSFKCNITLWQKGDFLGSGSFGTVYEGFTNDGVFFAVKEVSLLDNGSQGQQSLHQLEQEISLLSQFQHDNIVRYLGTEKDDTKLYIFLELVTKGSLAKLYQKYKLQDSQVSSYTRQILIGLDYLHCLNVVHRDIKCANILVDTSGSVKLADFGLAKASKMNSIKSCKGTPFWMAPEVVNRKNRGYGRAADIWSLGCTVLEMLTRQIPYFHLDKMQALFRIGGGELPHVPNTLSKDAKDFIISCLQVNPDNRPTAAVLLDHPFVRKLPSAYPSPVSSHSYGMRF